MTEKEFWRTTPRKLFALLDAHNRANSIDDEDTKDTPKRTPEPPKMTFGELMSLKNSL